MNDPLLAVEPFIESISAVAVGAVLLGLALQFVTLLATPTSLSVLRAQSANAGIVPSLRSGLVVVLVIIFAGVGTVIIFDAYAATDRQDNIGIATHRASR
jgi:hypothetical protein